MKIKKESLISKGTFIAIEGLDGSGQSTQAEKIKRFFNKKNLDVVLTKEPYLSSESGRKIQEFLDEKKSIPGKELQELFTLNRKEHLENIIVPSLMTGKIVISDRYFFSTFAFGASDGIDLEWLIYINKDFPLPDLTFVLKVSPEVCVERIKERGEGVKLFDSGVKLAKDCYEELNAKKGQINIIKKELNEVVEKPFKD